MPYNRRRRHGEDVLSYAVETDRISAASVPGWRGMIAAGAVTETFIENLASPYPPEPGPAWANRQTGSRPATPVAAASTDTVTATSRARMAKVLGLHTNASSERVLAEIDRLKARTAGSEQTPVAAAAQPTEPPMPVVNAELNPAVYEMATRSPQGYRDALRASGGRIPTLFPGGDLPAATASGIPPSRLAAAHWAARPAIAAMTDRAEAEEMLAAASGPNGAGAMAFPDIAGHPGLREYREAVRAFNEAAISAMRRRDEDGLIAAGRAQRAALDARRDQSIAAAAGPCSEDDYRLLFGHLEDAS